MKNDIISRKQSLIINQQEKIECHRFLQIQSDEATVNALLRK